MLLRRQTLKTEAGSHVEVLADDDQIRINAGATMTPEEALELVEMILDARRALVTFERDREVQIPDALAPVVPAEQVMTLGMFVSKGAHRTADGATHAGPQEDCVECFVRSEERGSA